MKRVRSQNQPLWFKILSGLIGLVASLSSAFCVFSLAKLGLFPFPLTVAIGFIIAILTVILVAMQFALTTTPSSQIGLSLLTIIVSLVMAGASFFFFQESDKSSSDLTKKSQSNQLSTLQSKKDSTLSSNSFSFVSEISENEELDISEEMERNWAIPETQSSSSSSLGEEPTNQIPGISIPGQSIQTSESDNGVVVDQPLYIPPADSDNIYVDEPLYVPPTSSTKSSSIQSSISSES